VTGAAVFVPFVAGSSGVRPLKFFAYAVPTMVLWATGLAVLGYFVGNNVETIDRIISRIGLGGLAVAALLIGWWIWRHRRAPDGAETP
jgi:membrane protein DedA with SNARE-associated domain